MPNLKDIRIRINSVKTTRQVTSAMKMVSAAKFKKAQDDISYIRPYVDRLAGMIYKLSGSLEEGFELEWSEVREPNKVLIVPVSSNRGLCGGFNANVIKEVEKLCKKDFKMQNMKGNVDIIAIGKQVQKILKSRGYNVVKDYNDLYSDTSFEEVINVAQEMMEGFVSKKYDKVVLVYNEYKNAAVQFIRAEQFLPMALPTEEENTATNATDYIIEPDVPTFIKRVIPDALKTMFYRVILESLASEHGARMTSMHKATDNATDMLSELQLQYNKARQGAITTEILEIVGGAEALQK
ncbi:ATP synthase F1 subunit gamma [Carboxylicivirga sp. M1479]|uniref:ATP synthase F1 subunit gamma n=1 Tax=Carboxylicivirga sp. M1479 TaxID=2594476 RepID=UPI00117765EB|nr:ATP synthase F1 subunit gamma [Carboxylicivirga sp. M1479]TRX71228.1 ATP synthase F1 subunit gamma [Carboxylicivirga sp. M1479]